MVGLGGQHHLQWLLWAASASVVLGTRSMDEGHSAGAMAVDVDAGGLATERPPAAHKLNVLAATFNAGNVKCPTAAAIDDVLNVMVEGHETADLVITGFQEYRDKCSDKTSVSGRLEEILWREPNTRPVHQMQEDLHEGDEYIPGPTMKGTSAFPTGFFCHKAKHYDTDLHIFASPHSAWEVTMNSVISQPITTGIKDKVMSCGKVLNFLKVDLVLKESDPPVTTSVCALNAHFSFAGKAKDRSSAAEKGFELVNVHNCASAFWVADFNTRLHCDAHPEEVTGDVAASSCRRGPLNAACQYSSKEIKAVKNPASAVQCQTKCDADKECTSWSWCNEGCSILSDGVPSNTSECTHHSRNTGFKRLTETLCSHDGCKLVDGNRKYDELTQILEEDTLHCYEGKESSDKGGFELETHNNAAVAAFGWKEAGAVNFDPSYKVKLESETVPEASELCTGDKYCLSSDGKAKHNFAWTDRVIMKGTMGHTSLQTQAYQRKEPRSHYGSDHLPVSALIEVTVT